MPVKVKGKDLEAYRLELEDAFAQVRVGILPREAEQPHPNSGLTIGEIAAIHEFGLGHVPERSFVRDFVDEQEDAIKFLMSSLVSQYAEGKLTMPQACAKLGEFLAEGMKARMDEGIAPALLDATIRRKESGSSVPLEDTRTLRDAISYEYTTRRGKKDWSE